MLISVTLHYNDFSARVASSRKRTNGQNKHNSILLKSYSLNDIPRSTSTEATSAAYCDSTAKYKLEGVQLNT